MTLPILVYIARTRLLLRLADLLLRAVFFHHGCAQHLVCILLGHLVLLLLLSLGVLFLFLLLLLVLFVIFLIFVLLVVFLLLLIIGILFELVLAKSEIIARPVINGVVAQRLFIALDGRSELLLRLEDYAHVVINGRLVKGIFLAFGCLFILLHGIFRLALRKQGVTQIVSGSRVGWIQLQGFAIIDIGIGKLLLLEQAVSTMHV